MNDKVESQAHLVQYTQPNEAIIVIVINGSPAVTAGSNVISRQELLAAVVWSSDQFKLVTSIENELAQSCVMRALRPAWRGVTGMPAISR